MIGIGVPERAVVVPNITVSFTEVVGPVVIWGTGLDLEQERENSRDIRKIAELSFEVGLLIIFSRYSLRFNICLIPSARLLPIPCRFFTKSIISCKYHALDTNQHVAHGLSIAHPDFQGKNRFSLLASLRRTLLIT